MINDPLTSPGYDEFLAETANGCRADDRPCPACCAGGICDGPGRRSDDAHEDDDGYDMDEP
jgi:hypothetical protein